LAIFKRKNDSEVEQLRHRRQLLDAQRSEAERTLAQAVEARRKTLLEADESTSGQQPKVLINRLRDERDAVVDAINSIDDRIREAEERIAQACIAAAREAEAARRRAEITTAREALDKLTAAVEDAVAALQPLIPASLAAGAAASSTKLLGDQAKFSITTGLFEVENYVVRMVAGNATIIGQAPAVVLASKPAAPPIERTRCMLYQNSKWCEPDGAVKVCARHGIADLPRDLAERTIAAGLAVREDSDLYLRLRATDSESGYGQAWGAPSPDYCLDLDNPAAPKSEREETAATPAEYVGAARHGLATVTSPSARW
jgi:hypothetical protein